MISVSYEPEELSQSEPQMPAETRPDPWGWRALLALLLVVGAATYLLYLLLAGEGALLSTDSYSYVRSALYLFEEGELAFLQYALGAGVVKEPLTHYPPLTSLSYYLLMLLDVPITEAPVVLSLLAWPLLLGGISLLTYRLCGSATVAVLAAALGGVSYSYLLIYQFAWSEVLFLPVLTFAVAFLTRPPAEEEDLPPRLVAASALLSVLMMARFSGGFIWLTIGAWWVGWRLWQGGAFRRLLKEGGVLAAAALPLAWWLLRSTTVAAAPVGGHLNESAYSLMDGLNRLAWHGAHLLWPAVRAGEVRRAFVSLPLVGEGGAVALVALLFVVPAAAVAYLFWRHRGRVARLAVQSPIVAILLVYLVGVYGVLQPFANYHPIDGRDAATALCLFQPWLLAVLFLLLRQRAGRPGRAVAVLAGYVLLNMLLLGATMFHRGTPDLLRFSPPGVESLAGHPEERRFYGRYRLPEWLRVLPTRTKTLPRHHERLLEELGPDAFVLTGGEGAFQMFIPYRATSKDVGAAAWLRRGDCALGEDVAVVLFRWDQWVETSRQLESQIDRQCPALRKQVLPRSVLYTSPASEGAERQTG